MSLGISKYRGKGKLNVNYSLLVRNLFLLSGTKKYFTLSELSTNKKKVGN